VRPFRIILHPTDFSQRSQYALSLASSLARHDDARLILLHVWSPPLVPLAAGPAPVRPEDFASSQFDEELRQLRVPDPEVRVERRLEQGDAATEIIRVAQETHCDLIVIGTHGRTGLERLLMGSVAEQVLRDASCPVLAVKTPFQRQAPPAPRVAQEASHR
jgi:nucleotide-binding universal stress UspA family protein